MPLFWYSNVQCVTISIKMMLRLFVGLCLLGVANASSGITNGGKFGIACTVFMFCVMVFTYVKNYQYINAYLCCKSPPQETSSDIEAQHNNRNSTASQGRSSLSSQKNRNSTGTAGWAIFFILKTPFLLLVTRCLWFT